MKLLITGACDFFGRTLAESLTEHCSASRLEIVGLDNLARPGSWINREALAALGVALIHGDVRMASDVDSVGPVDWIIDAAANPSVLAGVDGNSSPRQVVENNLLGTVNLLEHCRRYEAGFTLLSTSRVYSVAVLAGLPMRVDSGAFVLDENEGLPEGVTPGGIDENCSTAPPVSLYGSTKACSEHLALEYGAAFNFPVRINRCGVFGAGQFARADQGIFSYWLHSWKAGRPLKYLGFEGHGHQVRDCLHPRDLAPLIIDQWADGGEGRESAIVNVSGGSESARSLRQLSDWCADRWGGQPVEAAGGDRAFDLPWVVLDHTRAAQAWHWRPQTPVQSILEEIARFAEENSHWLDLSSR